MATVAHSSQSMEALTTANLGRTDAARAKRRIRDGGYQEACEILLREPESIASMRVYQFLEAVPKLGEVKARKILVRRQIWPLKRVGELTMRQRQVLALDVSFQARGKGFYRMGDLAA